VEEIYEIGVADSGTVLKAVSKTVCVYIYIYIYTYIKQIMITNCKRKVMQLKNFAYHKKKL
jgi:hypothetical protein